jgi:hypothetical protein
MWNSYNLHIRFLPYRKSLHLLTQKAASNVQLGFVDSLLLSSLFLSPRTGRLNRYNRLLCRSKNNPTIKDSRHINLSGAEHSKLTHSLHSTPFPLFHPLPNPPLLRKL